MSELQRLVQRFRDSLVAAVPELDPYFADFPKGTCAKASLLLAAYLHRSGEEG
ncbi:hypothetical protein [Kitasatospora indigofera]|uniref:hypothetical protein n=1 Tax=Kitasatospora indigofera TaxID=67307 RepID=UPI0033AA8D38